MGTGEREIDRLTKDTSGEKMRERDQAPQSRKTKAERERLSTTQRDKEGPSGDSGPLGKWEMAIRAF